VDVEADDRGDGSRDSRIPVTGISDGAALDPLASDFARRHFHRLNSPGARP
jgi:hypothetical protein